MIHDEKKRKPRRQQNNIAAVYRIKHTKAEQGKKRTGPGLLGILHHVTEQNRQQKNRQHHKKDV